MVYYYWDIIVADTFKLYQLEFYINLMDEKQPVYGVQCFSGDDRSVPKLWGTTDLQNRYFSSLFVQ